MLIPYHVRDAAGGGCEPALVMAWEMGLPFPFYVIHRHRRGARKARRRLRRVSPQFVAKIRALYDSVGSA